MRIGWLHPLESRVQSKFVESLDVINSGIFSRQSTCSCRWPAFLGTAD